MRTAHVTVIDPTADAKSTGRVAEPRLRLDREHRSWEQTMTLATL